MCLFCIPCVLLFEEHQSSLYALTFPRDRLSPVPQPTLFFAAGDIADPRHPLRFHNVVSNLKRDRYPGDESFPETSSQQPTNQDSELAQQHSSQSMVPDQADMPQLQSEAQATASPVHSQDGSSSQTADGSASNSSQPDTALSDSQQDTAVYQTADAQASEHDTDSDELDFENRLTFFDHVLGHMEEDQRLQHLQQRISELKDELSLIAKAIELRSQVYGHPTALDSSSDTAAAPEPAEGAVNDLYAPSAGPDKLLSRGGPVHAGQVCICPSGRQNARLPHQLNITIHLNKWVLFSIAV